MTQRIRIDGDHNEGDRMRLAVLVWMSQDPNLTYKGIEDDIQYFESKLARYMPFYPTIENGDNT